MSFALAVKRQIETREPPSGQALACSTPKNRAILLILRDLIDLGWETDFSGKSIAIKPPPSYDKAVIKEAMSYKREEILRLNKAWIDARIGVARDNLADGADVLKSEIAPVIEVCKSPQDMALFRILRYYWSSPYSDYVGRRIKLIVRDTAIPGHPVIGIAALGSPIIHIPEREEFMRWSKSARVERLNYTMDAYVIGALPPYNHLLGGKLISYLLTSNEVREIFREKYKNTRFNELAGIFTTSLYGKSAQYNRLAFGVRPLYFSAGETKGFGTFHIKTETFNAMRDFLEDEGIIIKNEFGDGPSWGMRVIRHAGGLLGFNPDDLLKHSFRRKVYFVPLAMNALSFLRGNDRALQYYRQSAGTLVRYWKKRWLHNRRQRWETIAKVNSFRKEYFNIL